MTLNEFGKDDILRTLAWQPIAVAAGCLASFVIKIVFDYIPLRCDIDAPSMPPLLSLPLSMACDDSDGCAMMNLKGYEKGEIIHTLAWQRIAFAAMADEKMLRVHWRPSVVQSYNDDVIVHTSLLPDFVIVTECRGKIYGGFFDNMAVNWELTFPTKHEKFWSWERNLRAWLEKTVEMPKPMRASDRTTTNSSILSQTAQLLKAKLEQCSGTIVAIFYVVCVVPSAVSVRLFDSSNFARAFDFSPVFFLLLPYVVEMPADPWVRLETKDRGDLKLDLKTRGMCLVPY
ncbi:hypothetical protein Tco_0303418 [Tanacetum coccineum]